MRRATGLRSLGMGRFRTKLLLAMTLVIAIMTLAGILVTQRRAEREAQVQLQHEFQLAVASLHRVQDLRNAAVADRSRSLGQNARLHAALEDDALDLLYPSAGQELRDLMERPGTAGTLHARFYRFLGHRGAILVPPNDSDAGVLRADEEAQLSLASLSPTTQIGYLARRGPGEEGTVDEIMALPIRSTKTKAIIAALVLGFRALERIEPGSTSGMSSGILAGGRLQLSGFDPTAEAQVVREVERELAQGAGEEQSVRAQVNGLPHLLFFKRLNPHSTYPPAFEVCVYSLQPLLARQRHLRGQILGAGGLLFLGGLVVSGYVSRVLSKPVEKLAVVSEENFAQKQRAEARLQTTAAELQRSARFSADASHELKSPITVLRAGLDFILARRDLPPEIYEEISSLIYQTYRLTGVVEDLLLLSKMDAGQFQLNLHAVDLTQLIEKGVDDLSTLPDWEDLQIESEIAAGLQIAGEMHYTALILQNLLDNARKYNRAGGTIRLQARAKEDWIELCVANTGRGIPVEAQSGIFERFHRAGARADVPGHGLGLNLARELARLHGGELRLISSDAEWTEFSVTFHPAQPAAGSLG